MNVMYLHLVPFFVKPCIEQGCLHLLELLLSQLIYLMPLLVTNIARFSNLILLPALWYSFRHILYHPLVIVAVKSSIKIITSLIYCTNILNPYNRTTNGFQNLNRIAKVYKEFRLMKVTKRLSTHNI